MKNKRTEAAVQDASRILRGYYPLVASHRESSGKENGKQHDLLLGPY